ncbi:hypothetical protein ABZS98_38225, partial [Streptomyces avermitilis]
MPPELLALVTHHCRHINAYLARAQHLKTLHGDSMRQWQRLVLYALIDALAHNHLLVGTLAAHLQRQDLDADLLRRYLQSPDPDRYITREAVQHLDGLQADPRGLTGAGHPTSWCTTLARRTGHGAGEE